MRASPADTIVAVSTALGPGAIAIVRLSGSRALDVADAVFRGARLRDCHTHTVHHGCIVDSDGGEVDEVLATVMRAPGTYTTEDMVEFGCHGGTMPAQHVLEACLVHGARLARRGEFTERAFLGGRIDLAQAEAVADIVAAKTPAGLAAALGQLTGGLSQELARLRDVLLDLRADIEALIDYGDEEIQPPTFAEMGATTRAAAGAMGRLLSSSRYGAAIRDGMAVAIVGRPNVGKSSLMNALLMRDRAIVTEVPGTTRDAIEEYLDLDGVPVRLVDTAGLRESSDVAERAGVERARGAAAGADLVLLVVDASRIAQEEDATVGLTLDPSRTVVVGNKWDLGAVLGEGDLTRIVGRGARAVLVSAATGAGLETLRGAIVASALGVATGEPPMITNARHIAALSRSKAALERAGELLVSGGSPEIVAVDLGEAMDALGEITGETTPEDVLERIFERFCVGK